jgi:tetratricopeptide (TPR) repeat protein
MNEPVPNDPFVMDAGQAGGPARRLWNLWRQGRRPRVQEFLADAGDLTPAQLVALLRVDQRERWLAGEPVMAEVYLGQHLSLEANAEQALDLVYGEYLLREQLGQAAAVEEYVQRFPRFAEEFRKQIELHRAVRPESGEAPFEDRRTVHAAGERARPQDACLPDVPGYRIMARLGRGGMGVVYKAWQVGLKRLVALKMISGADPSNPEQRARFRTEAEAVARLQHPHIVQIYEIGEHDGLPYYSMELVGGGSLDQVLAGTPQPVRPAAQLIETLARAIHAAHEKGIIHRDLKPANVLLAPAFGGGAGTGASESPPKSGPNWVPKITDFGLAKCVGSTPGGHTRTGQVLGSPSYMAPEQAAGRTRAIGPATDVYSLGTVLYELIVGRPPFQGTTVLETLEQVRSQEPVPPRRLLPTVPRDLETICLKCLEKEPVRRYASAAVLAEDLRRFQAGEPIRARPAGQFERGLKWARRRPAVAALTGALAAAVVGLLGLGVWSYVSIRQALKAKEVERQNAVRARGEAEGHRREATARKQEAEQQGRQALGDRDTARKERDQARKFLAIACLAVDRFHTVVGRDALFHQPNMEGLRRRFLGAALNFYEQLVKERSGDADIQEEQAKAYMRYAQVTAQIGSVPKALTLAQEGRDIFVRLHQQHPGRRDFAHDLSRAQAQIADLLCDLARPEEGKAAYAQSITILEQLTLQHPTERDYQDSLASSHHNLGLLLFTTAQSAEAEKAYRKALLIKEKLATPEPFVARYHRSLALTQVELACLYQSTGRAKEARSLCRRGLRTYQRLAGREPANTRYQLDLGRTYIALGGVCRNADRPEEARTAYLDARAVFTRLVAAHKAVTEYHRGLAISHHNLAEVYQQAEDLDKAAEGFRKARLEFGKLFLDHPAVTEFGVLLAGSTEGLASVLRDMGQVEDSLPHYTRAIEIMEKIFPKEAGNRRTRYVVWKCHANRAEALSLLGRHAEALKDLEQALRVGPAMLRNDTRLQQAVKLARQGKRQQAAAAADALVQQGSLAPYFLYGLACVHGRCAELPGPEAAAHADRAMHFLAKARAAGFFANPARLKHLKKDPDLKAVRARVDYMDLVAGLEKERKTAEQ